ncbi:hypothetical protein [Rudaea sp.]|uniref:hypothetical protein n=1 Tax=Rudaea sp. TaxID=2136325 RepID=UPI002ED61772
MRTTTKARVAAILLRARAPIALSLSLVCAPTFATLTVGAGSSLQLGDGKLDLGCSDFAIAGSAAGGSGSVAGIANLAIAGGSLSPGVGRIALGGNFSNTGTFIPGSSAINIVDACGNGTSRITGANAFYDFIVNSASGKQLVFPAGVVQNIAHAFVLQGTTGNLLQVLSSTPGTKARLILAAGATQTISYVNARDNDASGGATIAPGTAANYHSVDGGGLLNWFATVIGPSGGAAVPAPALGRRAMLLLAALLAAFAWRQSRHS